MSNRAIAAFLNYKRHDLAEAMGRQLQQVDQVVCFDNGGDLTRCPPGVGLVVKRPDNLLFARGWNWAMPILRSLGAPFVWMLNDDVEGVSRGMLDRLLAHVPEDAAAVTPAFNSPHQDFLQHPNTQGPRPVPWIDWTCPLVRMEAWEEVGPFDDRFLGYGADLDWCKRARDKRWTFYVLDSQLVHHIGSATAISQGLQHRQGNVAAMERLLREKWGVKKWQDMIEL